MSNLKCLRRVLIALVSFGAILLVSSAPRAAQQDCPDGAKNVKQVTVTVNNEARKITVNPKKVEIYLEEGPGKPGRVCWIVSGLNNDQKLHIDRKTGQPDLFPSSSKQLTLSGNSGSPANHGRWEYKLWVTPSDPPLTKDPVVIIKKPGAR